MEHELMFNKEEANGAQDVVRRYLLEITGDLSNPERRALGRILAEAQFTLEMDRPPPGGTVCPFRR